jgi:hypothetical protein
VNCAKKWHIRMCNSRAVINMSINIKLPLFYAHFGFQKSEYFL